MSGYGSDNRKKARLANANLGTLPYACRFVLRPEMQNEAKFQNSFNRYYGIEFIEENGGGPGVRLRKGQQKNGLGGGGATGVGPRFAAFVINRKAPNQTLSVSTTSAWMRNSSGNVSGGRRPSPHSVAMPKSENDLLCGRKGKQNRHRQESEIQSGFAKQKLQRDKPHPTDK